LFEAKNSPPGPPLLGREGEFSSKRINENHKVFPCPIEKKIIYTAKIYRILLPFSYQEKGPGDEFLK
jgi:hypothetical protein